MDSLPLLYSFNRSLSFKRSLDLNKRGSWRKLLPGTMHTLVWKGVIDDDDSTVDGDDESNSDEDESDNGSDSDEDNSRKIDVIRSELGATEISAEYESLMNSVQLLSNQYGLDNPACSPISGEALRDFYRYCFAASHYHIPSCKVYLSNSY